MLILVFFTFFKLINLYFYFQISLKFELENVHSMSGRKHKRGTLMRTSMKAQTLFTASLLFLSASASAERYIVFMKSRQAFSQMHSQVNLSADSRISNLSVMTSTGQSLNPFANVDANIEESLNTVQAIVINSEAPETFQALKANPYIVYVEKEFFHPGPKPVAGFHLTSAWDFELAYMAKKKPKPKPNPQPTPVDPTQPTPVQPTPTQPDNGVVPTVGPKTPWGILAVKAPEAWIKSNYGQGARVAVIDTGIDKDHPALAPNFEQGKDFINDGNQPYSFADKVGHGSHCAGTIAGASLDGGWVGVAPKAKILSGRVCADTGCSNIAVAQAINWAVNQKVDVISMSLGGDMISNAEKSAIAAADAAGIVVVAASGNDGTAHVSFPAALPTVISVGAINSQLTKANFSQYGPELSVVAPGVDVISSVPQGTGRQSKLTLNVNGVSSDVASLAFSGSPELPQGLTGELVEAGLGMPADFTKVKLTGKIALIKRGQISFADKVKNAIAAEAIGVIIYNNDVGLVSGAITTDGSTASVPVVGIEQAKGLELIGQIQAGTKVQATIMTIRSDYESYDGTSMATPHVAGVSALIRAANKNLKGADVKSILRATATVVQPSDLNQTGAGLVNAAAAVSKALGQ
jgi:subtilisin family serine protease